MHTHTHTHLNLVSLHIEDVAGIGGAHPQTPTHGTAASDRTWSLVYLYRLELFHVPVTLCSGEEEENYELPSEIHTAQYR